VGHLRGEYGGLQELCEAARRFGILDFLECSRGGFHSVVAWHAILDQAYVGL
jgi:hypothetical protein